MNLICGLRILINSSMCLILIHIQRELTYFVIQRELTYSALCVECINRLNFVGAAGKNKSRFYPFISFFQENGKAASSVHA